MSLDPVTALLDVGGKLIDKLFPDPAQRDSAKLQLFQLQQSGELAVLAHEVALAKTQTDINQEEAKSTIWFVAGWRPYIGWICGTGLAYQFLVYPILIAFQPKIVSLDMGTLITLLAGMLGLGTLRTYEKSKGVS
jgi:hypothetical protein